MKILEQHIVDDGCGHGIPQQDNSGEFLGGVVSVYFRDLEAHLCKLIACANTVVGCVAWLTNHKILDALAGVGGGVCIVVQKEDFLRPDSGHGLGWKADLRRRYSKIGQISERHLIQGLVGSLSVARDPTLEAVRCVGNHNKDRAPAFPRMHNKFLVFCGREDAGDRCVTLKPAAVWTGSFNLTKNATASLENAVVVLDQAVASAYLAEWEQIVALSEPLDWESEWCEPQWRVGT